MLVVDLHCELGHLFEGWFASADELSAQQARGLVTCPVCGDHRVTRRPSAPHLNVAAQKAPAQPASRQGGPAREPATAGQGAASAHARQAMYLQAVRHVLANTEDVGDRFADEVRGMHHGDVPERAVRGQATEQEREALQDEGIDVLSLPLPDGVKGSLR